MNDIFWVVYAPKAKKDLREIYIYISSNLLAPLTAKNQVNRIRTMIRSLDSFPSRYPIVDWEPWKSMGMHRVPVDNYAIFYTVDNQNLLVTIIRIVYSGRDIAGMALEVNE